MEFKALGSAGIWDHLSERGRAMYIGPGIFYWVERARKEADLNGTIGVARGLESDFLPGGSDKEVLYYLPVVDRALRELPSPEIFNYSSEGGLPGLRQSWKEWIFQKASASSTYGQPGNCRPSDHLIGQPIVTPGLTGAISAIARLFLNPGDSVVVTEKRWEVYDMLVEQQIGGKLVEFATFDNGQFNINGLRVALDTAAAGKDKVLLLLNIPHNPTGYVPDEPTVQRLIATLVEFVQTSGKLLLVLLDDAYEGFVFEPESIPCSLFNRLIGLHPRLLPVKMDAVSKEFLFWGGRLGFITYAAHPDWPDPVGTLAEMENKTRAMLRSTISTCVRSSQAALCRTFEHLDVALAQRKLIFDVLTRRVKRFKDVLHLLPAETFQADPFSGGFFLLLNVDPQVSAVALADRLLRDHRIGLMPINRPGVNALRITFACIQEQHYGRIIDAIVRAYASVLAT